MTGQEFGAEGVKALRLRLGLSQTAFARKVGVNLRTLQRWEAGDNQPVGMALAALRRLAGRGKP